jgi:general secretion pathway protein D
MNRKPFLFMCMALLLAPGLMAQTDSDDAARWQFAQAQLPLPVPLPQRRVNPRSNLTLPTNSPANYPAGVRTPVNVPPPAFPMPSFPRNNGANGGTVGVGAETRNGEVADISYNFPGVPVKQLLDIYADLVGRTLLRATSGPEAVPDNTTITLNTQSKLTRTEAIQALETILDMNGITIVPIGDKFAKVVTEAIAPSSGGMIATNTNSLPESGKFVTQIVQIKYADPKDLQPVLEAFSKSPKSIIIIPSTGTLILRDYAENVARMMEMVAKIDVLTPNSIKPEVIPIKYALASDIASALSALGASGGTAVGKSTTGAFKPNTSATSSFGGGGTGGTGGFGSTGGSSYGGQSQSTSALGSSATSGRSSFQNNLAGIVKNAAGGAGNFQLFGQTKIIADERTNSLLVFANDEDMKMIKLIISKLDVVLAQVLIDAIIMEINLQDTRNTGISYGGETKSGDEISGLNNLSSAASGFLTGSSTTNNTANAVGGFGTTLANLPGGFSYFGKYGNDLDMVLEATAGNSRINVLSRPRIQTSHAVEADLFIGNTVPYVTGTYNYGYGSGPSSQYTQLEVGITLQVTPLINPDGLVVMDIQADVQQLGPSVQIAGVGGVPTTTERKAGAKVAVRNGETIILGGFISDSRSTAVSGIPYLMNIPGLGNLFRSTSIENLRTELIMLMRPTVLPTPEVAAVVATEERNKLSGVKQAELEIRQDEAERNLKIEQELAKDAAKAKKAAEKNNSSQENTNNLPSISTIPPLEDQ